MSKPSEDSSFVADITVKQHGALVQLDLLGVWTVNTLHQVEAKFALAAANAPQQVTIHLGGITRFDTAGALVVNETVAALATRGIIATLSGVNPDQSILLEKALPQNPYVVPGEKVFFVTRLLAGLGKYVCGGLWMTGQLIGFFGQFLTIFLGTCLHPSRMRWTSFTFHLEQVGLRAVPIVALLTFLIGVVVAYMGSQQLAKFGAPISVMVNMLEVLILREMSVLITAIVVAGRSSSSFTAQIGAMVANEEVAAMRSMGLDPVTLLVTPRVLSLVLALPLLVFIADLAALLGGAVALWVSMDLRLVTFIQQFYAIAHANHFLVGLAKTPFFALAIGIVGCFQGFRATSSAESVGFLTTISVVQAIFIVILLDAVFAIFFTSIGV